MEGVKTIGLVSIRYREMLDKTERTIKGLRMMGKWGRDNVTTRGISAGKIITLRKKLQLIMHLIDVEHLKVVERDETITRAVKSKEGYVITVPLIFYTSLPAKRETSFIVKGEHDRYKVSSTTPTPPHEVLETMNKYKSKFDELQVWWVPNDVLVEKIKDPDPILVGVLHDIGSNEAYFELYRWVDTTVESKYWSHEGY